MFKYILGLLKNIFNPNISIFARIDTKSRIDKSTRIFRNVQVFNSHVEKYSYVGPGAKVIYANIGSFCSIAGGSIIGLGNHPTSFISTSPVFYSKKNALRKVWTKQSFIEYKRIVIGNDVWIGSRAIIMGGVNIGNGAIIGAGAVVTKDVPAYAIVGGIPAKIIRYRFEPSIVNKIEELKWWENTDEFFLSHIESFNKQINEVTDLPFDNE